MDEVIFDQEADEEPFRPPHQTLQAKRALRGDVSRQDQPVTKKALQAPGAAAESAAATPEAFFFYPGTLGD